MSYNFNATDDYITSQSKITTLVSFARNEETKGDNDNRNLFLKLAVVLIVTRFQVYIESVLEEFLYNLKLSKVKNNKIPLFLRLHALKILSEENVLRDILDKASPDDLSKLKDVREFVKALDEFSNEDASIAEHFVIRTKFPMGKQGLKELKNLFKQIEGKDIFVGSDFDIDRLNEILNRRHQIVHEDGNSQLTEIVVENYIEFTQQVVTHIDSYLGSVLQSTTQ